MRRFTINDVSDCNPEDALSTLIPLHTASTAERHVIFVHGLRQPGSPVWQSSSKPSENWPLWLKDDFPDLNIWTIEHESAKSNWFGTAMPLFDRARNLAARIIAEERLRTGDIYFVTHSFGGLIVEQLIRSAEVEKARADSANLLSRIRGVVFLGTPHTGSKLGTRANALALIFRPSPAARALPEDDPNLRELNHWFRNFAASHGIQTLAFQENKPIGWLGKVVKPESANPGMPSSDPVLVDEDHFGIAAPKDRSSEVFTILKRHLQNWLATSVSAGAVASQMLTGVAFAGVPVHLVDAEIEKRVLRLRKARFFVGFESANESVRLGNDVTQGELRTGSSAVRAQALGWVCRVLVATKSAVETAGFFEAARALPNLDENKIADAFRLSFDGDESGALAKLATINTPQSKSAAFMIAAGNRNAATSLKWLADAGIELSGLDPDGKFFVLQKLIDVADWGGALTSVDQIQDSDFDAMPGILYVAAVIHMAQAVPAELRPALHFGIPFNADEFPLAADAKALDHRRKAAEFFTRAEAVARSFDLMKAANDSADHALWLRLMDPAANSAAMEELAQNMRDPSQPLRRLPMAFDFNLKVDLPLVEAEVDRQTTLSGGKSVDAAIARLALAFTKKPEEAAAYLEKHRGQLNENLNPQFVGNAEIQVLAAAKLYAQAEARLKEMAASGLGGPELGRLERILAESKGADPVEARENQFKATDKLPDLVNLVELLASRKDWPRLVPYARQLFSRTRDIPRLLILARTLHETRDFATSVEELGKARDLVDQSDDLRSSYAWALFQMGELESAGKELAILRQRRDNHSNDRFLGIHLAIASGDWPSLLSLIEEDWANRDNLSGADLLGSGQLAQQLNSPRARQLIEEAAAKGKDDPSILVGCYSAATQGGWENDAAVFGWLNRATELSGDDGPIQKVSMQELLDRQPDWQRRADEAWDKLRLGEIPMFAAAKLLNRTLIDLTFLPALANPLQADVRRRSVILAYSGTRLPVAFEGKAVALDPTALLTLTLLGVVDKFFATYDRVMIPHATLGWLLQERQKIQFHQPSQIRDALEIKRLLDGGQLEKFEPSFAPRAELLTEVGDDLAAMLTEASMPRGGDTTQRVVVRSSPLHRVGSLMEEEADVKAFQAHLCGCMDVVQALKALGQLTAAEEEKARSYLRYQEKPWPQPPVIAAGATLYLDDVAVSYFQHLGLLPKLKAAGFTAKVSPSEVDQGSNFVKYESQSSEVTARLDTLREQLAAGIKAGKVRLGPNSLQGDGEDDFVHRHPTFNILQLAELVDAVVIDDRNLNQHGHVQTAVNRKPLLTTHDLLARIDPVLSNLSEHRAALRRAGYAFVPLESGELTSLLEKSQVNADGRLVETAELKAIRENLLLARMRDVLQLPKESGWWDSMFRSLIQVLKAQWAGTFDENVAKARSEWLLHLLEVRGWPLHASPDPAATVNSRFAAQVALLASIPPNTSREGRRRYWAWLQEAVIDPIKGEHPDVYALVLRIARDVIGAGIRSAIEDGIDEEDADEG